MHQKMVLDMKKSPKPLLQGVLFLMWLRQKCA
ncbi:hypothetical protein MNBD_GAMMA13-2027 [hydrothermal vent metagenome]|uniref:Uncharacterized protein n=1 Tax=hydrothermal vent metagenome TaxID=652676 RepID=A0A3B0YIQ7_9ZZZZ